ncbi:MAG: HAD family hydrolase [Dehalococcoidia bacterium]
MSIKAIVLDFDGVILESVDTKTQAFQELFRAYPKHQAKIRQLHLENLGMSRYEKFHIIYRDYLRKPLEERELTRLDEAFSQLVQQEILTCPLVPGAREFLQKYAARCSLFVVSATPEEELRGIVAQRGLAQHFQGVYGAPRTKSQLLRGLLAQFGWKPSEVVFVGDAVNDYLAAQEGEVPFVGRVPAGAVSPFPQDGILGTVEDLWQLDARWPQLTERVSSLFP